MIAIRNSWHGTNRELPDVNIGDIIPARLAQQVSLEMCGYIDCAKCGPLGEHGQQPGFVVVPMGDGSVFISPLNDDFDGMAEQGHHQKNRSDALSESQNSDDDTKSDEKQPARPNPVEVALSKLLSLHESLGGLPLDVRQWMNEAITKYLRGETPTLDQALCLCLPISGTQPAGAVYRYEKRNRHLRDAANLLAPGERPGTQAKALSKAIFDYETESLPSGELHAHIKSAHQIGLRVPASPTGLAPILGRK